MTSVNFPLVLPPNAQELFSFALGFIAACIILGFIISETKSKRAVERASIFAVLITIGLLIFIWRPI